MASETRPKTTENRVIVYCYGTVIVHDFACLCEDGAVRLW